MTINIELAVFFLITGYLTGKLFKSIDLIKGIIILCVVPLIVSALTSMNNLESATIPFLLGAPVGYWGIQQTKYRIEDLIDRLRDR